MQIEAVSPMNENRMEYALAKQTPSMEYIHTNYGDIDLDDELNQAVQDAVERVLYKRLGERPPITTETVEIADVQIEAIDRMSDLTGKSADTIIQLMFDAGFENFDSLARLIKTNISN